MKKKVRKKKHRLMDTLDIPVEILGRVPRITLVGSAHMLVENHCGVYEYADGILKLGIEGGKLHISGRELVIREIDSLRMLVCGDIESVHFEPSL